MITIIKTIKHHEDNAIQRLISCIPNDKTNFQVNINKIKKRDTITAWHCHRLQDDIFIALKGKFKVGLVYPKSSNVEWVILDEAHNSPQSLFIPARTWHGVKSLEDDSIILYYMSREYNKQDIYILPVGYFGEIW